jgi:SRSO17 transposase
MYCGALGKRGNCQIGVSVNLVSDRASSAVDWRLFIPDSWDDATAEDDPLLAEAIRRRRQRAGIPDHLRHREKWRLALDMLDETRNEWELPDLPVVADAGYGDATGFRSGLTERGLAYAVAVKGTITAYPGDARPERPPYSGRGRPPRSAYPHPHTTLRALVLAAGRGAARTVTWRQGTKSGPRNSRADMRSRFVALRVRPANRDIPRDVDGSLRECWLLAEWPPDAAEPTDDWLSTLPDDTPLRELVRIAKIRWRIEHDYRELKDGLGLDHFEGRSYLGWHRHVTLPPSPRPSAPSSASTQKPLRRPDPLRGPPRVTEDPGHLDRRLLDMRPTRTHTRTTPQDLTKPYYPSGGNSPGARSRWPRRPEWDRRARAWLRRAVRCAAAAGAASFLLRVRRLGSAEFRGGPAKGLLREPERVFGHVRWSGVTTATR